jgi:hypothetical protein
VVRQVVARQVVVRRIAKTVCKGHSAAVANTKLHRHCCKGLGAVAYPLIGTADATRETALMFYRHVTACSWDIIGPGTTVSPGTKVLGQPWLLGPHKVLGERS